MSKDKPEGGYEAVGPVNVDDLVPERRDLIRVTCNGGEERFSVSEDGEVRIKGVVVAVDEDFAAHLRGALVGVAQPVDAVIVNGCYMGHALGPDCSFCVTDKGDAFCTHPRAEADLDPLFELVPSRCPLRTRDALVRLADRHREPKP